MEGADQQINNGVEPNAGMNADQLAAYASQVKSLADTKKRRKDIERDAQLLANRIALLKQEEMKTWKKIEETKKRTGDIQGLKKRNEEKVQKKILDIKLNQEQKAQLSTHNYMTSKQRADEKERVKKALLLQKNEEFKQAKQIKDNNEQKKRQNLFRIEQENRMKNQIGLQSKRLAQMKLEEEKRRKISQAQREHANRLAEEEALKNIKMDEVQQMEKLEMELIKRLQNTQAIQKEAYLELEKALSQPSAMLNPNALKQNLNLSDNNKVRSGSQQKIINMDQK